MSALSVALLSYCVLSIIFLLYFANQSVDQCRRYETAATTAIAEDANATLSVANTYAAAPAVPFTCNFDSALFVFASPHAASVSAEPFNVHLAAALNGAVAIVAVVLNAAIRSTVIAATAMEHRSARSAVANFALLRVIVVFALLPVEAREYSLWIAYYVFAGALKYYQTILRERIHSLSAAVDDAPIRQQMTAVATVALTVLVVCAGFALSVAYALFVLSGLSLSLLLVFELVLATVDAANSAFKANVFARSGARLESAMTLIYYNESFCEVATQLLTAAHIIHVWYYCGLSITVIDLFLFLHIRSLALQLFKRCHSAYSYRLATYEIETRYADATTDELAALNDTCAICREEMKSAKRLPCGHFLHKACLHQWMEYKSLCPICRYNLAARTHTTTNTRASTPATQNTAAATLIASPPVPPAAATADPPLNDANLPATLALIRRLQEEDDRRFIPQIAVNRLPDGSDGAALLQNTVSAIWSGIFTNSEYPGNARRADANRQTANADAAPS